MVEEFSPPTYWSLDSKLTQVAEGQDISKRLIWVYDIKPGQSARWAELIGKIKKVYEEKRAGETFIVVWNNFADTKAGMDAAVIFGFDKWAWMDRNSNFSKLYEEVHGEGKWRHFMNEFNETINGRVDWMRVYVN
jgi:hypothetical protein